MKILLVAAALVLSCLCVPLPGHAQENGRQPLSSAFFDDNKKFLDIIEPVNIGQARFAARIDEIRKTREPLGLVLSGGSARAFAHIGVLRALEEKGIHPDFIVANSMGAVLGLLYAAGFSPDTIDRLVSEISIGDLIDPVMPLNGGFINAGRFASFIRSIVGDTDIADLPIPILVIFEDLKSRRQVRVMEGDFSKIMAAAFAMPAVFEPVKIGDYLLIDGGVTNLVPASAAFDYTEVALVSITMYDKALGFSNPFAVINRALDIGKTRSAVQQMVDYRPVVIRNDVEHVSYMDYARPRNIINQGYRSAQAAMPAILAVASAIDVDPALREKNELYTLRVNRAIDGFAKGIRQPDIPQALFVPQLRFADAPAGDSWFDSGRRFFGVHAVKRRGTVTTSLGLNLGIAEDPDHRWSLLFSVGVHPGDGFFADAQARLSGGLKPISAGIPFELRRFDAIGKAGYIFGSEHFIFTAFGQAETDIPVGFGMPLAWTPEWRALAGIAGRTHKTRPLAADASTSWFVDSRGNAGPEWALRLSSHAFPALGLRIRAAGRHSLFGPGTPLTAADAYRGENPVGLAQGWFNLNAEAVWQARILEFDAGEMIIVNNIEIGPFFDAYMSRPSAALPWGAPVPAAGLTLAASLSFLGLAPIDLSVSWGTPLDHSAWRLGFYTGRLFPL